MAPGRRGHRGRAGGTGDPAKLALVRGRGRCTAGRHGGWHAHRSGWPATVARSHRPRRARGRARRMAARPAGRRSRTWSRAHGLRRRPAARAPGAGRLDHRVPQVARRRRRASGTAAAHRCRPWRRRRAPGRRRLGRGRAMTAPGWSAWPAPAKLNLFLHITGRRADGYHELQTVFRLLDWGDTVHLRPRMDGRIVRHGGDLEAVPDALDLSLRAAKLLQKSFNVAQGADIRVEKRIPAGAGLGGGSSDAATVLCALGAIWGVDADRDALALLAARLGADVPVFVHGCSAWAEGVGEVLVPMELPPAWYVVADPGVHVATATLFQAP